MRHVPWLVIGAVYGVAFAVLVAVIWRRAGDADRRHAELLRRNNRSP